MVDALSEASQAAQAAQAGGPDPQLIQQLVEAPDSDGRRKVMEANAEQINTDFVEALTNLLVQLDGQEDPALVERVREVYRDAVRFSMESNMGND